MAFKIAGIKIFPRKGRYCVKNEKGRCLKNVDKSEAHFGSISSALQALRTMCLDNPLQRRFE